ncbi:hypothetical protein L798_06025, partial [Zootermopsis nevadensis]
LSFQDHEFVNCVVADIKQFVNRSRKNRSVLVFPPVNNYRRFLIHKVSEEYPEELCTFSIGQGHGRRTVVCFKRLLIRDLHQTRPTDEPVSDTSQPVKRLGTMGVECQRVADEAAAAPAKDNNVKRGKAVPTVGIYRPPAARRSEEQTAPLPRSGPSTVEIKCDRTRPGRQRRPDIQVYVPRARRLLTGGQDRIATSTTSTPSCQESSGQNLRTQENLLSKNLTRPSQKSNSLLPSKDHKSKSAAFQCDSLPLNSVSLGPDPNETDMEVSKWTESMGQAGESNCDLSNFSSEVNDVEQFNMDSMAKSSDDSDQFQDFSDAVHENEFSNSRDEEVRNIYGDTSSPSSVVREKRDGSSEDGVRSKNTFVSDECHKKNENDCRVQEEQNRKNRRIIRRNYMSDVLIISEPVKDVTPLSKHVDSSSDNTLLPSGVFNKKKKVQCKADKHKSSPVSDLVSLNLNPDECTWDMMFDDDGECLDPKLMEELTKSVGSVTIEKPQSDYRSFQSHVELVGGTDDEFSHVLEIYNFPAEFKTNDLCAVFSPYMKRGFEIKWVDDTHALGVFSSSVVAAEVLAAHHPFVKTRPLHEATHESRMKARRSAEFLQPCRVRPETCAALARRLVTGALGVRLNTSREEREAERKILSEAR